MERPYDECGGAVAGSSGNIKLCPDGKYRWAYELPMMRNPAILFTVWKVLAIASLVPAIIVLICTIPDGAVTAIIEFAKVFAIVLIIVTVVSVIGYVILAAIYGWNYFVLFEMDEKEITHAQQPRQFKKAEAIGWLVACAGAASNNLSVTGAGLLATSKSGMTIVFKNVDSVIGKRRFGTIKVNQLFSRNQIYVDDADYDFVWEYIASRCTKAKIKK